MSAPGNAAFVTSDVFLAVSMTTAILFCLGWMSGSLSHALMGRVGNRRYGCRGRSKDGMKGPLEHEYVAPYYYAVTRGIPGRRSVCVSLS